MNINHLRYFEKTCQHMSITKASEEIFVAQPTITAAIKELEKEFGFQLFEKVNNQLVLTTDGRVFFLKVREFLSSVDNFEKMALDLKKKPNVTLRLGVPPILGTFLLGDIIPGFELQHPGIHLELLEIPTLDGLKMVDEAKLDLLIGVQSHHSLSLCDSKSIFITELTAAFSPESPLSKETVIEKSMLEHTPFVILPKGSFHYYAIKSSFEDLPLSIIMQSNQVSTIRYMIKSKNAATIIFQEVFENDSDICCRPLAEPIAAEICVFWRKHAYLSNAMKVFIRYIQNCNFTYHRKPLLASNQIQDPSFRAMLRKSVSF
ncbi:LysR family transcriptional regulator [Anoxybacterium hadale]|uniref:LysR family transcriptional regulator n=1 Tax=Anoxybacterium hadale TaxID=3408580 RepID=A0ACD1A7A6_9FIRM|nr:LysR family transcriptional regulator [Clostridiales bacterium]